MQLAHMAERTKTLLLLCVLVSYLARATRCRFFLRMCFWNDKRTRPPWNFLNFVNCRILIFQYYLHIPQVVLAMKVDCLFEQEVLQEKNILLPGTVPLEIILVNILISILQFSSLYLKKKSYLFNLTIQIKTICCLLFDYFSILQLFSITKIK